MTYQDARLAGTALQNMHKAYWYVTVAAIAHPATRKFGFRMASYGGRVTLNVARAGLGAAMSTPLSRGGTLTVGVVAKSVAAGYAIGALAGTGIAYAGWGKEGAKDAIDLYTFQVSPSEYANTVSHAIKKKF